MVSTRFVWMPSKSSRDLRTSVIDNMKITHQDKGSAKGMLDELLRATHNRKISFRTKSNRNFQEENRELLSIQSKGGKSRHLSTKKRRDIITKAWIDLDDKEQMYYSKLDYEFDVDEINGRYMISWSDFMELTNKVYRGNEFKNCNRSL